MQESSLGWYLIFTKPRQESIAAEHLKRQHFVTYLPYIQQHKRIQNVYRIITESLFPRYLFVQLSAELDDWSKIRSSRGCISLVRFGIYPARVPDILIEQLKKCETDRIIQQQITPHFKPNDRVQILDGLLEGYEGMIKSKDSQQRVTLLLKMAEGHTCSIRCSIHQIKKIG
jgi:transcriptional antiterminator RfaH